MFREMRRVIIQWISFNLFENAIQYSLQGSKILVSIWRDRHWVQNGMKDQGPGIPPAHQENISALQIYPAFG
jgi:K+-sensing histidine kinase KdpD